MVGLLPDGGVQPGVRPLDKYMWTLTYKWANTATRTSRSTGLSTATSASSTSPGVTAGCSVTVTAAPTCSSSPGQDRPAPDGARHGVPGRPGPWPSTGPSGDSATPPLDGISLRLLSAARPLSPLRWTLACRRPRAAKPPRWEQWLKVTRKAVRKQAITAERTRQAGRNRRSPPGTRALPASAKRRQHGPHHRLTARPRCFGACLSPVR